MRSRRIRKGGKMVCDNGLRYESSFLGKGKCVGPEPRDDNLEESSSSFKMVPSMLKNLFSGNKTAPPSPSAQYSSPLYPSDQQIPPYPSDQYQRGGRKYRRSKRKQNKRKSRR